MTKREFLEVATIASIRGHSYDGKEYGDDYDAWLREKGAMAAKVALGAWQEIERHEPSSPGINATWLRSELMPTEPGPAGPDPTPRDVTGPTGEPPK